MAKFRNDAHVFLIFRHMLNLEAQRLSFVRVQMSGQDRFQPYSILLVIERWQSQALLFLANLLAINPHTSANMRDAKKALKKPQRRFLPRLRIYIIIPLSWKLKANRKSLSIFFRMRKDVIGRRTKWNERFCSAPIPIF